MTEEIGLIFQQFLRPNWQLDIKFKENLASKRLLFVKVVESNYKLIYELFGDDKSPFVDERFKDLDEVKIYFYETLGYLYHTHTGCDWLLFEKKSKKPIGVVHLYGFSRETVNNKHKRCTIGFAINENYRRKYFATEAITRLTEYIFAELKMEKIIADADKKNYSSKKLLKSLNFVDKTEDYYYADKLDFYELEKKIISKDDKI